MHVDQLLELERLLVQQLEQQPMFHHTSCSLLELRTSRRQQLYHSTSSSCKRKSLQADHASSSHVRYRKMELRKDRRQRFQHHSLELRRMLPFQRHSLGQLMHMDRKKRFQRHSLEHMLICMPTCP